MAHPAATDRLAAIVAAEHARSDALEALKQAAEKYMGAVREHGSAVYAEHGPDSPPDDSPKWGEAFDAALAISLAGA